MKLALPILSLMFLVLACGAPTSNPPAQSEQGGNRSSITTETQKKSSTDNVNFFADLPAPYKSADYDNGKRIYRLCVACHLLTKDGGHRVGPNLHGIIGRKAGSSEGFRFSRVVIESEIVWTPEKIDEWLANPRSFLPGNRMSFSGVRKPEDRRDVIAYIMYESAKD